MLIEQEKRPARVRFRHPIRVVTLEGQPRVIRTLTANVSRKGLFLRMPQPLPNGTKVALSLEAGGRALGLAQAEVMWGRHHESALPGRYSGCGVRFTEFLHPRANELVDYLVDNLDRGKPLVLPSGRQPWRRFKIPALAALICLFVGIGALPLLQSTSSLSPEGERVGVRGDAAEPVDDEAQASETGAPPTEPNPSVEAVVAAAPTPTEPRSDAVAPVTPAEVNPSVEPVLAPTPSELKPSASAVAAAAPTPPAQQPSEAPVAASSPPLAETTPSAPPVAAGSPTPSEPKPGAEAVVEVARPEPKTVPALAAAVAPKGPVEGSDVSRDARAAVVLDSARTERKGARVEAARTGSVKLPSGGSSSLGWSLSGKDLRLSPELLGAARLKRAFVLDGPPRAVFDITGPLPKKSTQAPASPPYATGVRLGKQGDGTRIVIDLDAAPKRSRQDDGALVLSF